MNRGYENSDIVRYVEQNHDQIIADIESGKFDFVPPEPEPEPEKPQTTLFAESELNKITKVKRRFKKPV
jgi:hypothetical protein